MNVLPEDRDLIFHHQSCQIVMCDDCYNMVWEWRELFQRRTMALMKAEDRLGSLQRQMKSLQRQMKSLQRQNELWERMAKMGHAEVVQLYLDDLIDKELGGKL